MQRLGNRAQRQTTRPSWLRNLAGSAVILLGLLTIIASGGGGGGDGGGTAPTLTGITLYNDEAAAGLLVTIGGEWNFTDTDGDLGGGSFNYDYGGSPQSIALPDTLNGLTNATVAFSLLAQLSDDVGEFVLSCWLEDSAGHRSNTVNVTFHQLWTRQFGTAADDMAYAIAHDLNDSVIVAGSTQGDLEGESNSGQQDVFVTKFSATAVKQWTRVYGSAEDDVATAVATDTDGNIYVTGYTNGTSFGGETAPGGTAGVADVFLSKFDTDGNRLWTVLLGTAAVDKAQGIVIDAANTLFITGETYGDLAASNSGLNDVFVTAYNSAGVQQWIRQIGTSGSDFAHGIALNAAAGIFIAGGTQGVLGDVDPTPGDPVVNFDAFVANYDLSGTRQWTRQIGTSGSEWAEGVVGYGGNAYLTGTIYLNAIGSDPAQGLYDAFLAAVDSDGVPLFTRQFGTANHDRGLAIGVDSSNNLYVTGFEDSVYMSDHGDIMLYKFDANGNDAWHRQLGDSSLADQGLGLMVDTANKVYVTGYTQGGLDGHSNAGSGSADIFVLRFDGNGDKQ
jgi:hypothetical protein